ncbi:phage tail protein I [Vibrio olivae]
MSSILPPNATKLEKVLVDVLNSPLEVSIRDLWNPQTCPKAFLPYLAQSYSVDRWDSNWSEQEKRAAIEAAFYVHKHKGTIAAVRRVVEPFGFLINVVEWWEIA